MTYEKLVEDIKHLKNVSGIYSILNTKTNKVYVGSSINLYLRLRSHFKRLFNNEHTNRKLQQSFNKHGYSCFQFEIEKFCDKEVLTKHEQYFIDSYDSYTNGYNLTPSATSTLGTKRTEEDKIKMSINRRGKLLGENNPNYGKGLKGEKNGRYGKPVSEETKQKMRSKLNKGKIYQYDIKNNLIKIWANMEEIKNHFNNTGITYIYYCLKGQIELAKGFKWTRNPYSDNLGLDIQIRGGGSIENL